MLAKHLAPLYEPEAPKRMYLSGEAQLSFGQLSDQCGRTRGLFDASGVGPGARVAIISEDRAAVTALYLSCLAHAATAVVLDPNASAAELTFKLSLVEPALIFADPAVIERCQTIQRSDGPRAIAIGAAKTSRTPFGLLLGRKKEAAAETYPAMLDGIAPITKLTETEDTAAALILFTSGTTSNPKGVVLDRGALAAQMDVLLRRFGLDASSRIVNHLPFHHSDGLNQGPLMAISARAELVLSTTTDMASLGQMLDTAYRVRATHLITVPAVLAMMDRLPDQYDDSFSHTEFAFIESTAGPLDDRLWARVEKRFGTRVVNCYGLTETVNEALFCGPDDASHAIGTAGKPDGFELRIMAPSGDDAAPGEPGELLLRGRGLMSGYFRNPKATEAALQDGWLHTGDLATCDTDGFVRIVGRIKSLIIRGGINILPEEIDVVARAQPGIHQSQTIGIPDEILGERVVLCIVVDPAATDDVKQRLSDHLRQALSKESQPNEIRVMPELPLGPSGKVDLPRLRALCDAGSIDKGAGNLGETVIAIAAIAFRADAAQLSPTDGTDEIAGWDSLAFLDFVLRIERQFDMRMAARDVMAINTLGDVITIIERQRSAAEALG